MGKLDVFVKRVEGRGMEVTNFGMVDSAQAAYALLPRLQAADGRRSTSVSPSAGMQRWD
jgi:hypothetical protein